MHRRVLAWLAVGVAAAASASCTIRTNEVATGVPAGATPVPQHWVGQNGLLADPASVQQRPSVEATVNRLAAARLLGVSFKRPDDSMVQTLMGQQQDPLERPWLRLRYDYVAGRPLSDALVAAKQVCASGSGDCTGMVRELDAFISQTSPRSRPDLVRIFPISSPACPERLKSIDDLYFAVACGHGSAVSASAMDAAEGYLGKDDTYLSDSLSLWRYAAVASATSINRAGARALVERSLKQSDVQGLFLDDAVVQGDLITTWALLHLAGGRTQGIDRSALADAVVHDAAGSKARDHELLADACLVLLGRKPRFPLGEGVVRLTDPSGPYNPFLAEAAVDAHTPGVVVLGFSRPGPSTPPAPLASWLITSRLLGPSTPTLTPAEEDVLRGGSSTAAPAREQLLYGAALAVLGRAPEPQHVARGVDSVAGWSAPMRSPKHRTYGPPC